MGKDRNTNQGPLSRRHFLGLGAGAGASMLLAACGGGTDAPPGAGGGGGGGGQFGEGSEYTGPNVSLAFWNGFTGGDGPFMRQLVEQFNGEHEFRAASSRDGRHWTWGGVWTLPAGTQPRIGLISHGGAGAVAEFDYLRIYQP